jgi:hypothetical protein
VGQVTLQLINDGDKANPIKWTLTCDVTETGPNICITQVPAR